MKRFKKLILWGLLIIILLIVIAGAAIAIFLPREKVKEMALERISTALNRKVTIEDISVSFWGGLGVNLEGIKVSNPEGFEWSQFLEAKSLDIKLKIWPLLRKDIRVDRLILAEPRIGLLKTRSGQINYIFGVIDSLTPPPMKDKIPEETKAAAIAISFENFSIENGVIEYIDDSLETGVSVFGLSLKSKLSNPAEMKYQLSGKLGTDSIKINKAGAVYPVIKLASSYNAVIDLNKKQAVVSNTEVELNNLKFDIKAGIPNTKTLDFVNLELTSEDISIEKLLKQLPAEYRTLAASYNPTGNIKLNAAIKYNAKAKESVNYSGTADIADLKAFLPDIPGEFNISSAGIEFKNDYLNLTINKASFGGNPLEGKVAIRGFDSPGIEGRFKGQIDLAFLNQFLPETGNAKISGATTFDLAVTGPVKDLSRLKLSGIVKIKDGKYTAETLPEPIESFALDIKIQPDKIILNKMAVNFTTSDIALTGEIKNPLPYLMPGYQGEAEKPYLTFTASSNRFNTDKLFPEAVPGEGTNPADLPPDSLPALILPDINGSGKASVDTLIYCDVGFTDITGDINIKDRTIYISNAKGSAYTGKVTGEMSLDLRDFNNPKYTGQFDASQIEVNDFLDRFTGLGGHLFGKIDMKGDFATSGWEPEPIMNSLDMTGDAIINEARLVNFDLFKNLAEKLNFKMPSEEDIRDMSSKFKVKDGRVAFDAFNFVTRMGDWAVEGSAGFDGSLDYSGTILLSDKISQDLMKQSGLVSTLAGLLGDKKTKRVKVPFKLGGSYTRPQVSVDLTSSDVLQENLGEALQNLFGK